uniref:Uncharacterized protein n=1 Tax=Clastoptera arizonana TaxID=38151 RepID=A0A1B6EGY1_9HEMI
MFSIVTKEYKNNKEKDIRMLYSNIVVKKTYELCLFELYYKEIVEDQIIYFTFKYPLINIIFELTVPKHIPIMPQKMKTSDLLYNPVENKMFLSFTNSSFQENKRTSTTFISKSLEMLKSLLTEYSTNPILKTHENQKVIYQTKFNKNTSTKNSEINSENMIQQLNIISSNLKLEKQKSKKELALRKPTLIENNLNISFHSDKNSSNYNCKDENTNSLKLLKRMTKKNINDDLFDFSLEAEKMVSSICEFNSPPYKEKVKSNTFSDVDQENCRIKDIDPKINPHKILMKIKEFKPNEYQKSINEYCVANNEENDCSKNTNKFCSLFHSKGKIYKDKNRCQNYNMHEMKDCDELFSSNIKQEALLFKDFAIKGFYDVENILQDKHFKLGDKFNKEFESVKKLFSSTANEVKETNTLFSDICLSFLYLLKSWTSISSHILHNDINNIFQNMDPSIPEYFTSWQYASRILMDKLLKGIKIINARNLLNDITTKNFAHYETNELNEIKININNYNLHNATSFDKKTNILNENSNLNFFVNQEIKMPDINEYYNELYLHSKAVESLSNQKFWKNRRFSKTNLSFKKADKYYSASKTKHYSSLPNQLELCGVKQSFPSFLEFNLQQGNSEMNKPNAKTINSLNLNSSNSNRKQNFCTSKSKTSTVIQNNKCTEFNSSFFNASLFQSDVFNPFSNYEKGYIHNYYPQMFPINTTNINNCPCITPYLPNYSFPSSYLGINGTHPCPTMTIENESEIKSTYLKPGCYNPPKKPKQCFKYTNFNLPIEDTPVVGVSIRLCNNSKFQMKPPTGKTEKPSTQHINLNKDIKEIPKELDSTWKAALASAESLCETLLLKPLSKFSSGSVETSSEKNNFNADINQDNDTILPQNNYTTNLSSTRPELRFKTDKWVANNSFNREKLNNDDKSKKNFYKFLNRNDTSNSELLYLPYNNLDSKHIKLECKPYIDNVNIERGHNLLSFLNYDRPWNENENKHLFILKPDSNECLIQTNTINKDISNKLQNIFNEIYHTDVLKPYNINQPNSLEKEFQESVVTTKLKLFMEKISNRLHQQEYETTDQVFNEFHIFIHEIRSEHKEDANSLLTIKRLEIILNELIHKNFSAGDNLEENGSSFGPIGYIPNFVSKNKQTC